MSLERRLAKELKARAAEEKRFIDGYASVFNSRTVIWDFEEMIVPGAFKRALGEKQNVRSLYNHDSNFVLGTTGAGTLVIREDDKGLWTETEMQPKGEDPMADGVYARIKRGDVDGMSFAFTVRKQEWVFYEAGEGKMDQRLITEIGVLYDVGPVTYPAYEATSIKIRQDAKTLHSEARNRWEEKRSRLVAVPASYRSEAEVFMLEARSGDAWVCENEKVEAKTDEKDKVEQNSTTEPAGGEGEKSPEAPSEATSTDQGEGRSEGDAVGLQAEEQLAADTEARDREIKIKRAIEGASDATRRAWQQS